MIYQIAKTQYDQIKYAFHFLGTTNFWWYKIQKWEPSALIHLSLTAHNWQKWKRTFLTCPRHKISREEAVGVKSANYTFKLNNFCEYVKFGAIMWKSDILLSANLKIL